MKKIFAFLIAMTMICSTELFMSSYAATTYKLSAWDLVDSGKHLDWAGTTNYMAEWYNAVNKWNYYKPGVIRVDRWNTVRDVKISDADACDGKVFAVTYLTGKIVFYHDTMDQMTTTQRTATIMHEIGHALGIDHNTKSTSIMKQGYKNFTDLDTIDKQAYDAAYKKY